MFSRLGDVESSLEAIARRDSLSIQKLQRRIRIHLRIILARPHRILLPPVRRSRRPPQRRRNRQRDARDFSFLRVLCVRVVHRLSGDLWRLYEREKTNLGGVDVTYEISERCLEEGACEGTGGGGCG